MNYNLLELLQIKGGTLWYHALQFVGNIIITLHGLLRKNCVAWGMLFPAMSLWPSLVVIGMFYYFPSEQQLIFFVPFPYIHWLVYHCAYHQRIRMCRSDEIWNEIWNETQMEFIWATLDNRNDDKICWLNKMARKMTMLLMVSPSWSPQAGLASP